MKRIVSMFGVAVMAVFAFTAISIAVASAETTKILPEPGAGAAALTDTATQSTAGHWLTPGGLEIKCGSGAGSETWTSANEGTGEVNFKTCTSSLSTVCTGNGVSTEGEIKLKGDLHFWLALEMLTSGTKLIGALVFLILPAFTFTCVNKAKTIKEEIEIKDNSCMADMVLTLNKLVSTVQEELSEWTSGETLILEVLPAGSTSEIKCLPTESTNGGTAELFALKANFAISSYKKGGSATTIELMNPEG
jgi:hypothetical protein